jgi:uroporphyrinogen decarboxylase
MPADSCAVIQALFAGRGAPRMGLHDSPWGDTVRKWVAEEGYPVDAQGNPVPPLEHFGFDMAGCGGWFDALPLRGFSETVEETAEWKSVRNGAGAVLKWWKDKSGTPEHIDFRMTSRAVWARDYRPHLLALDRARLNIEGARAELEKRRAQGCWTYYGHLFIWELLRCSLGDVCMFESLALDPDWIRDFGRVYTDLYKAHYRVLLEEAGKPDGIWIYEDLGYRNGLFCSPRTLAELIFPYYRELVDFFHGYGLPVVLHTCGSTGAALPLIVEAGFDGLNPMEAKAGNDLLAFAEQYGDRLVFVGGFDARILESGDRALIRRHVTELIAGMKARGARWVFGSDHSLSTRVSYASFRYALDVYREQREYTG